MLGNSRWAPDCNSWSLGRTCIHANGEDTGGYACTDTKRGILDDNGLPGLKTACLLKSYEVGSGLGLPRRTS